MTFGNTKTGKTGTSTSEATETAQIKSVESLDKGNDMERGLKNRHVQFIAIGGTIGTGLFLGSGKSIALTGPSIILVYIGVGLIMFLLMRAIGEMMYSDPSQHTFINFITRYLGRAWGKFAGWTYWIVLILTGMTEITAVSTYFVTFFGTFGIDLNAWKWLIELCFLVALTGINLIAVKVFGEAEFWFSMIKITLIVGLIVTAVVMLFLGFSYPATHIEGVDGTVSGATVSLTNITDGFQLAPNGWMNFFMSFQMVFFAYQLIEFVGVTVSETQNPRKVLPKAVNELIMRILIFYVGALVAIMAIVPWRNFHQNADGSFGSPFIMVFQYAGLNWASALVFFVVITAASSALNSLLYSAGRHLYQLSEVSPNPMLNKLGGEGNKGNQLIQVGGSFNSVMATITPMFVGILIAGSIEKATISQIFPVMYTAMAVFAIAFFVLLIVPIPEPNAATSTEPIGKLMSGALKFRHFILGAIAIFVYVGVEVGVPGTLNLFLTDPIEKGGAGISSTISAVSYTHLTLPTNSRV